MNNYPAPIGFRVSGYDTIEQYSNGKLCCIFHIKWKHDIYDYLAAYRKLTEWVNS